MSEIDEYPIGEDQEAPNDKVLDEFGIEDLDRNLLTGKLTYGSLQTLLQRIVAAYREARSDDDADRDAILALQAALAEVRTVDDLTKYAREAYETAKNSPDVQIGAKFDALPLIRTAMEALARKDMAAELVATDTATQEREYTRAKEEIDREALHRELIADGTYAANYEQIEADRREKIIAGLLERQRKQLGDALDDPDTHEKLVRQALADFKKSPAFAKMQQEVLAEKMRLARAEARQRAREELETSTAIDASYPDAWPRTVITPVEGEVNDNTYPETGRDYRQKLEGKGISTREYIQPGAELTVVLGKEAEPEDRFPELEQRVNRVITLVSIDGEDFRVTYDSLRDYCTDEETSGDALGQDRTTYKLGYYKNDEDDMNSKLTYRLKAGKSLVSIDGDGYEYRSASVILDVAIDGVNARMYPHQYEHLLEETW